MSTTLMERVKQGKSGSKTEPEFVPVKYRNVLMEYAKRKDFPDIFALPNEAWPAELQSDPEQIERLRAINEKRKVPEIHTRGLKGQPENVVRFFSHNLLVKVHRDHDYQTGASVERGILCRSNGDELVLVPDEWDVICPSLLESLFDTYSTVKTTSIKDASRLKIPKSGFSQLESDHVIEKVPDYSIHIAMGINYKPKEAPKS